MMLKSFFNGICRTVADLIYPRHCTLCSKTIGGISDISLCKDCIDKTVIPKVVRDDKFMFDEAVCAVKYEDTVKENMIKYKFKGIRYHYSSYVYLMDRAVEQRPYFKDALICSVPMSPSRDRLYSQTELIAEKLSDKWDSRYIKDLLIRKRDLSQLSKMNLAERKFNIKDSIDLNPCYDVYGKDILIIDDIFTSGTTTNECALILKMYGAESVYVLCPCYD